MNKHLPIHDWSPDDRPREKMQRLGHKSLTNSELLAILLGSGTPNESAVKLAQRILAHYDNNLGQLSKSSVENLCEFHGVGLAKVTRLTAAFNLCEGISNPHRSVYNSTVASLFLTSFNHILEIYSMKSFGSFISINSTQSSLMSNSVEEGLPKLRLIFGLHLSVPSICMQSP